jgi:hypothetical protein
VDHCELLLDALLLISSLHGVGHNQEDPGQSFGGATIPTAEITQSSHVWSHNELFYVIWPVGFRQRHDANQSITRSRHTLLMLKSCVFTETSFAALRLAVLELGFYSTLVSWQHMRTLVYSQVMSRVMSESLRRPYQRATQLLRIHKGLFPPVPFAGPQDELVLFLLLPLARVASKDLVDISPVHLK